MNFFWKLNLAIIFFKEIFLLLTRFKIVSPPHCVIFIVFACVQNNNTFKLSLSLPLPIHITFLSFSPHSTRTFSASCARSKLVSKFNSFGHHQKSKFFVVSDAFFINDQLCLSVRPSVRPSDHWSVYQSLLCVCPSVRPSVWPFVMSVCICPSVCSVCLSVLPSVCLLVCQSVCPSVWTLVSCATTRDWDSEREKGLKYRWPYAYTVSIGIFNLHQDLVASMDNDLFHRQNDGGLI